MPADSSNINLIAIAFIMAMGFLLLKLPRRSAITPMLAGSLFIPLGQQFLVLSLHFYMFRILIAIGLFRLFFRGEYLKVKYNKIDFLVVAYTLANIVIALLRTPTIDMLVNRFGFAYDTLGIYFIMRALIQDYEDIQYVVKVLAFLCVPVALSMFTEFITGRNLFSVFGGVPQFTELRDGKLRCQGPFLHPILAGVFAATLMPMFLYQVLQRSDNRNIGLLGLFMAVIIVGNTASSGPVMAMFVGILATAMWVVRKKMRAIRWMILLSVICLHIIMKAPVWALLYRVKLYGSSSSWHRYNLLDQFINRVDEWWLLGIESTEHWGYLTKDVANMFVRQGVNGGIVSLSLFIAIIIYSFNGIGKAIAVNDGDVVRQRLLWALGSSLFTHVASFFSVSYFDQIIVFWLMLLAVISTVSTIKPSIESVTQNAVLMCEMDSFPTRQGA